MTNMAELLSPINEEEQNKVNQFSSNLEQNQEEEKQNLAQSLTLINLKSNQQNEDKIIENVVSARFH